MSDEREKVSRRSCSGSVVSGRGLGRGARAGVAGARVSASTPVVRRA
jgi:hypothetical protein